MVTALPIDDDRPDAPGERVPYVASERDGRPTSERTIAPPRREPAPRREAAPQPRQQALPDVAPHDPNEGSGWIPPDELERQNKRAHAELGKDYDPKRLLSFNFAPEIARVGARAVQQMFGIGAGAVPEDGNTQALARNEGALTPAQMREAKEIVDPEGKLPPHLRSAAAAYGMYGYHLAQGDNRAAQQSAAATVLYSRKVMHQMGGLLQAAIERGDKKKVARILELTYDEIPDGRRLEAVMKGEENVELKFYDQDDNLTEQGEFTMNQLLEVATGMQNGTVWARELGAMSRPRRPSGGSGGGTAAQRQAAAEEQQFEATIAEIEQMFEGRDLSDSEKAQRDFALTAAHADRNHNAAKPRTVNKDHRDLMESRIRELGEPLNLFDEEGDPEGTFETERALMELATQIWERSPVSDPRTAAALAVGLMYDLDTPPGHRGDYQLRYRNTPINISADAYRAVMVHRAEMAQRMAEAGQPGPGSQTWDRFTDWLGSWGSGSDEAGDANDTGPRGSRTSRSQRDTDQAPRQFTETRAGQQVLDLRDRVATEPNPDRNRRMRGAAEGEVDGDPAPRNRGGARSRSHDRQDAIPPERPREQLEEKRNERLIGEIRRDWRQLQVLHKAGRMTDEEFERARMRYEQRARNLGFELEAR